MSWAVAARHAVLFTVLTGPAPALAQLDWSFDARAETDRAGAALASVGLTAAPVRSGWLPVARIDVYGLRSRAGSDDDVIVAGIPTLGLRYVFGEGHVSVHAGFVFTTTNLLGPSALPIDFGEGVVNAAQFEYRALSAAASYNYGAESAWARGGVLYPVMRNGDAVRLGVGAEIAYVQGNGVDSLQPGLLLNAALSSAVALSLGVGFRMGDGSDTRYWRVELRPRR